MTISQQQLTLLSTSVNNNVLEILNQFKNIGYGCKCVDNHHSCNQVNLLLNYIDYYSNYFANSIKLNFDDFKDNKQVQKLKLVWNRTLKNAYLWGTCALPNLEDQYVPMYPYLMEYGFNGNVEKSKASIIPNTQFFMMGIFKDPRYYRTYDLTDKNAFFIWLQDSRIPQIFFIYQFYYEILSLKNLLNDVIPIENIMFELFESTGAGISQSLNAIKSNSPLIRPQKEGTSSFKSVRSAFPDIKNKSSEIWDNIDRIEKFYNKLWGIKQHDYQKKERNVSGEIDIVNETYDKKIKEMKLNVQIFLDDFNKKCKCELKIIEESEGEENETNRNNTNKGKL